MRSPDIHRFGHLIAGRFIDRPNRFIAEMELEGAGEAAVHCADSGSMRGLLRTGAPVRVSPAGNPERKTRYTWELVRIGRVWVAVNTTLTNDLAENIIHMGLLGDELGRPGTVRREVRFEASRIDFLLQGRRGRTWLEVKSVTMCHRGRAAFPDSVTERGLRHLRCLEQAVRQGDNAALLFLVQRGDARFFEPAAEIDPAYAEGLRRATGAGVAVFAGLLGAGPGGLVWKGRIPVRI